MKSPDRILLMLAASDIELSELHHFFRSVERFGAGRSTDFVLALRRHAKDFRSFGRPKMPLIDTVQRLEKPRDMGREIQRQLSALNLPKHQLFELFQKEFRSMGVSSRDLPPFNKISLPVWFDRVSRRLGAEKLTQAASGILARQSPKTQIDWPLKREGQ